MTNSTARWVCVDASFIVPLVTRPHDGSPLPRMWRGWHEAGLRPAAPTLLCYEAANALHRYVVQGDLLPDEAAAALDVALDLGIAWFNDAELHRRALQTAQEQGLPAACDAHYLALAERLGAELWTADRRLHRAVGAALQWVRLVE
jgi:predicted nucleic acid-binding protein